MLSPRSEAAQRGSGAEPPALSRIYPASLTITFNRPAPAAALFSCRSAEINSTQKHLNQGAVSQKPCSEEARKRGGLCPHSDLEMPDPLICMATAGHPVEGVLHVGVRDGRDLPDYRACGASPCIYVEPIRSVFDRLNAQFEGDDWHIALLATCLDHEADRSLIEDGANAADGESLSLSAVTTSTVDGLVEAYSPRRPPNLLVIDARGAELLVLSGASATLPSVDGVFVAVNEARPHPMACTLNEVLTFLARFDLRPRWIEMDGDGHGQAFFTRPRTKPQDLPTYGGNLALGKAAGQSSLSGWSRPEMHEEARGAINGQITGGYGFHTDLEDHPWWLVDLGMSHSIKEVRVYNRLGAPRARARTLRILTSEDGSEWWEAHDQNGYTFGGADGRPLRVLLEQCRARYVAMRLAERTWLHLDEIEIY